MPDCDQENSALNVFLTYFNFIDNSQSVCPRQAFPPSLMFAGKAGAYPNVLKSRAFSRLYTQKLGTAEKACLGQTLTSYEHL